MIVKIILKRYPWILVAPIGVGIILVGINMAHTIYRASRYSPPVISFNNKTMKHTPENPTSFDSYSVIFKRDLFTSVSSSSAGEREKVEKTVASTAPFRLKGTVVVNTGSSIAIIEDPTTKKQEVYHQNDAVKGFKIVKILRNKVIVDKDGREEVLEVVEDKETRPVAGGPVRRTTTIQRGPTRRPVVRPVQRSTAIQRRSVQQIPKGASP